MDILELEELLQEHMPALRIETNRKGEVVIYTGLKVNEEEELVPLDDEEPDEDPDFENDDEDMESYEEDDEDD